MMPIIGYENAFRKNRATAATAKSAATNKNKRTTTSRYGCFGAKTARLSSASTTPATMSADQDGRSQLG